MHGNRNEVRFAGQNIDVIAVPPIEDHKSFFKEILLGFLSLLKGMRITWSYFSNPKTIVTSQYPENRETLKISERAGSFLELKYDKDEEYRCTGCKICEKACPNNTITILGHKGISKRNELVQFIWRMDTCTFCNACVASCPFDAIEFTNNFESAVFDRRTLIFNLNRYAGPPSAFLQAMEDPEERKKAKIPIERFLGTPLSGVSWDGTAPLGTKGLSMYDVRRCKESANDTNN